MLNIVATNFGVNPADIRIECSQATDYLVLDGEFTVDTTAEAYAGIRPMQLTVGGFVFGKTRVGTAIVTVESEGVKYATVTKVWLSDKKTINIAKVIPYKSTGAYTVRLSTVLLPEKITGTVSLNAKKRCTPVITKGSATDLDITIVENPFWLMLVLKAGTLTFDEDDNQVVMTLPGVPSYFSGSFPVFYNEGLWVALGSKYYPATLLSGVLTISKDGAADEATGTGNKFTRVFLVRSLTSGGGGFND